MSKNRVIPVNELVELICQDRQVINKNTSSFQNPQVKKRHDDIDFDKEVSRINEMYSDI